MNLPRFSAPKRTDLLSGVTFPLIATVATCIVLFPVYWMVACSFQSNLQLRHIPAYIVPPNFDVSGYKDALSTQIPHVVTSLFIGCGTVLLALLIAVPAAYALAQFSIRFTGLLVLALLVTQMIPAVMMATPLYLLFNSLGLINTYPGLILADSTYAVPFAVLILRAFLQDIPHELREAALIDGAGEWRTMWSVILPLARPGLIAVALFGFLFGWGDFLFALTLSTNGSLQPLSLSIYLFIGEHITSWNSLMAAATLAAMPAAVMLVAAQRYIGSGLTAGAVRG